MGVTKLSRKQENIHRVTDNRARPFEISSRKNPLRLTLQHLCRFAQELKEGISTCSMRKMSSSASFCSSGWPNANFAQGRAAVR